MTTEEAATADSAPAAQFGDAQGTTYAPQNPVPSRMARRLKSIGKYDVYQELSSRSRYLAPFDMRQALDPEVIRATIESRVTRPLPLLEGFRNTLVVLPLMITWFSLALAALAYQQSINLPLKGSNVATEPFFQQWQAGFPLLQSVTLGSWHIPLIVNHARIFTFADVGLLDFVILAVLLLLTAFIHLIEGYAIRVSDSVATWVDGQLFKFTKDSVAWSMDPNAPDKPRWAVALEEAIFRQVDSVATVQNTAGRLTDIYMQVQDIYRALEATLPTVKEQIESMGNNQKVSTEEWQQMVEQLRVAIIGIARVGDRLDPAGPSQELTQRAYRAGLRSRPIKEKAGIRRIFAWFRRSR